MSTSDYADYDDNVHISGVGSSDYDTEGQRPSYKRPRLAYSEASSTNVRSSRWVCESEAFTIKVYIDTAASKARVEVSRGGRDKRSSESKHHRDLEQHADLSKPQVDLDRRDKLRKHSEELERSNRYLQARLEAMDAQYQAHEAEVRALRQQLAEQAARERRLEVDLDWARLIRHSWDAGYDGWEGNGYAYDADDQLEDWDSVSRVFSVERQAQDSAG